MLYIYPSDQLCLSLFKIAMQSVICSRLQDPWSSFAHACINSIRLNTNASMMVAAIHNQDKEMHELHALLNVAARYLKLKLTTISQKFNTYKDLILISHARRTGWGWFGG